MECMEMVGICGIGVENEYLITSTVDLVLPHTGAVCTERCEVLCGILALHLGASNRRSSRSSGQWAEVVHGRLSCFKLNDGPECTHGLTHAIHVLDVDPAEGEAWVRHRRAVHEHIHCSSYLQVDIVSTGGEGLIPIISWIGPRYGFWRQGGSWILLIVEYSDPNSETPPSRIGCTRGSRVCAKVAPVLLRVVEASLRHLDERKLGLVGRELPLLEAVCAKPVSNCGG